MSDFRLNTKPVAGKFASTASTFLSLTSIGVSSAHDETEFGQAVERRTHLYKLRGLFGNDGFKIGR
jgi:hypothetical protein